MGYIINAKNEFLMDTNNNLFVIEAVKREREGGARERVIQNKAIS